MPAFMQGPPLLRHGPHSKYGTALWRWVVVVGLVTRKSGVYFDKALLLAKWFARNVDFVLLTSTSYSFMFQEWYTM